jgi:hypothetical protein
VAAEGGDANRGRKGLEATSTAGVAAKVEGVAGNDCDRNGQGADDGNGDECAGGGDAAKGCDDGHGARTAPPLAGGGATPPLDPAPAPRPAPAAVC